MSLDLPFPDAVPETYPEIARLLARVGETYDPAAVLLFGSRARGDARGDSDWDILVLLGDGAHESLLDPLVGWETQRGSGVRADVLVAYLGEFVADLAVPNTLAREIRDQALRLM